MTAAKILSPESDKTSLNLDECDMVFEVEEEHEEAFEEFLDRIEADDTYVKLCTYEDNPHCGLWVQTGKKPKDVPCYAVAEDAEGNALVLTLKGKIKSFTEAQIL